ncbi:MAG: hypothetical protein A2341_10690 [Deltaproteobacteria bacterium RIFOXYB12_FULL_58_9]|nr:MAG: hypothetical protein A2341_10690 [Deltaproteobacteria bacterium RIFOXYB12_FULL_58_9]
MSSGHLPCLQHNLYGGAIGQPRAILSPMPFKPLLGLLVGTVAGCGNPSLVRILVQMDTVGHIEVLDVSTNIDDFTEVRGAVAQLWSDVEIEIDATITAVDRGGSRESFVSHPRAVSANWVVDGDVAIATDFESLSMLTAYAHLEAAAMFFNALHVATTSEPTPVYFHPTLAVAVPDSYPTSDNATYFPEADGFIILPMLTYREVPFAMNRGVLAHEMAHRIFYYEFFAGELFATLEQHRMTPGAKSNWQRIRATDEGVADFFGAAIAHDPQFLSPSVPDDVANARRLDRTRILDPAWVAGDEPTANGEYLPYLPGAVVAAALWQIAQLTDVETVSLALIAAQRDLAAQIRDTFTYRFGELEAAVVENLPANHRTAACTVLSQSHTAAWAYLASSCP